MRRKFAALAIATSTAVTLAACQQGSAPEPGPTLGNAVPVDSPEATDPDGDTIDLGEVSDLAYTGDAYAVRVGDELLTGTLDELRKDPQPIDIAGCTDVTANAGEILVTCGDEVRFIGGETLKLEQPAASAVVLSDGSIVTASGTEAHAYVYRDGELADDFPVGGTTDELAVTDTDQVVRINRETSTIQDFRLEQGRQGGTLRVGVGVGTASAGPDGLVIVSDTSGSQIAVYTVSDVVRLHQTAPVAESPYAVAHDGTLAWIASTSTNTATGYDITRGVPMEQSTVNTIANVRAMVATDDGLVLGGSDGLQIIPQ